MKKKDASPPAPKPYRDRPDVLPLKGEIDLHVSPVVTASLTAMIEKKPQRMVIDLSDVTYIDSAGLRLLFRPCKKWKRTVENFRSLAYRRLCAQFSKSRGSIRCSRSSRTRIPRWPPHETASSVEPRRKDRASPAAIRWESTHIRRGSGSFVSVG